MGTDDRPGARRALGPLLWWAAPSVLLLAALTLWGVLRYPDLPDRVPRHIGPGGVDAWTDRSVGAAFLPVFVYAGLTVLMIGCALAVARTTPLDELPPPADRWAAAARASTSNRPADAASVRRTARALLLTNALLGLAFLPMAWVQWRAEETAHVPWGLTVALVAALLVSLAPVLVAAWRDAQHKRAARARAPAA
ncbi:DUF1648 domain-containing protein [Streptomyces sp. DSM 44915]|uniref:DUF1648 domain-containing protein n=1 Tax=Streptomyces chisholmiae TaxID=3075540 RepID=A0ABU2JPG8_9ACTN|nr:DUF1648 domain-containing protein [Streptomyces sp. DSM 44915]MDT0266616.1 DUF1648 domain-containing protein [Streptomyces sp. DSM 44915]